MTFYAFYARNALKKVVFNKYESLDNFKMTIL